MKKWYQQKTTWVGIGAVVTGLGGMLTGEMEPAIGLNMIAAGFIGIFLRQGVEKTKEK